MDQRKVLPISDDVTNVNVWEDDNDDVALGQQNTSKIQTETGGQRTVLSQLHSQSPDLQSDIHQFTMFSQTNGYPYNCFGLQFNIWASRTRSGKSKLVYHLYEQGIALMRERSSLSGGLWTFCGKHIMFSF